MRNESTGKEVQVGCFCFESSTPPEYATVDAARSSLRFDLALILPTGDVQCSKCAQVFPVLRFWKAGDMVNQGFRVTEGHEYLIVLESE
jgi:hypothetical protein